MLNQVWRREGHDETADAAFLRRLKEHDSSAWAELYDSHYNAIWRYVLARTGSRDAADDLAAQVFVEALESIQRFEQRGKPILAWLYTIARNHAGKWARTRRRESGPPDADLAAEQTGAIDEALALSDALNRLTKEQREVIALRFYAGHSTSEIAVLLGKNERAVYSAEARAFASLRRYFNVERRKLTSPRDEFRRPAGIDG